MRLIPKHQNAEAAKLENDAIQIPSYVRLKNDMYEMSRELADQLDKQIHTINEPSDPRYGEYDKRWDSRDKSYGTQLLAEVEVKAPLTWEAHNNMGAARGGGYANQGMNKAAPFVGAAVYGPMLMYGAAAALPEIASGLSSMATAGYGTGAGLAPLMPLWKSIAGDMLYSTIGGETVNLVSQALTGKKWGENVRDLAGLIVPDEVSDNVPEWLKELGAEATNPGYKVGLDMMKLTNPHLSGELPTFTLPENKAGVPESTLIGRSVARGFADAGSPHYQRVMQLGTQRYGEGWTTSDVLSDIAELIYPAWKYVSGNKKDVHELFRQWQELYKLKKIGEKEYNRLLDIARTTLHNPREMVKYLVDPEGYINASKPIEKEIIVNRDKVNLENAKRILRVNDQEIPPTLREENGIAVYDLATGYRPTVKDGHYSFPLFEDNDVVRAIEGEIRASEMGSGKSTYNLNGEVVDTMMAADGSAPAIVPQEYLDATRSNIDYINLRYGGNLISYGSSNLVSGQRMPHSTHDYDFYITKEDFEKFVLPEIDSGKSLLVDNRDAGNRISIVMDGTKYGANTLSKDHPARIDFSFINPDELTALGGKESRAVLLFRQLDPAGWRQEGLRLRSDPNAVMKVPYSELELFTLAKQNEKILSILDSLEASGRNVGNVGTTIDLNSPAKHVGRWPELILGNDPLSMDAAIRLYAKINYGPEALVPNYGLEHFLDVSLNLELLKKLEFPGNITEIAKSPEATRNAFNLWYVENSGYTRHFSYEPGGTSIFNHVSTGSGAFKNGSHEESIYSGFAEPTKVNVRENASANGTGINATIAGDSHHGGVPSATGNGDYLLVGGVQPTQLLSDYATPMDLYDRILYSMRGYAPATLEKIKALLDAYNIGESHDRTFPLDATYVNEILDRTTGSPYKPEFFEKFRELFPDVYGLGQVRDMGVSNGSTYSSAGSYGAGDYVSIMLDLTEPGRSSWNFGILPIMSMRGTNSAVFRTDSPIYFPESYGRRYLSGSQRLFGVESTMTEALLNGHEPIYAYGAPGYYNKNTGTIHFYNPYEDKVNASTETWKGKWDGILPELQRTLGYTFVRDSHTPNKANTFLFTHQPSIIQKTRAVRDAYENKAKAVQDTLIAPIEERMQQLKDRGKQELSGYYDWDNLSNRYVLSSLRDVLNGLMLHGLHKSNIYDRMVYANPVTASLLLPGAFPRAFYKGVQKNGWKSTLGLFVGRDPWMNKSDVVLLWGYSMLPFVKYGVGAGIYAIHKRNKDNKEYQETSGVDKLDEQYNKEWLAIGLNRDLSNEEIERQLELLDEKWIKIYEDHRKKWDDEHNSKVLDSDKASRSVKRRIRKQKRNEKNK